MTCWFYVVVAIFAIAPTAFAAHYWYEAQRRDWKWISRDSRTMYVDAAKTLITASGIAVALVASTAVVSARTADSVVALSARVAVACLVACVCFSFIVILALLRGFERAQSRHIEKQKAAGTGENIDDSEGKLNNAELLWILLPTVVALSCFLVGFLFLARIAFHI